MSNDINLEAKLKQKLDAGEISEEEYNNLIIKFGDLDLLSSKIQSSSQRKKHSDWRVTGSRTLDGDEINKPVKVSGRLNVNGDLKCKSLSVSGATLVDGSLMVVETTKLSGKLTVNGEAKFGDTVKISGKLSVDKGLFLSKGMKVSGKINVKEQLVAGGPIKISGKLNAESIQSKSSLILSGKVNTQGDLLSETFESSGGSSNIGGNLQAKEIFIAKKYREMYSTRSTNSNNDESEFENETELGSLADIGKFVSNLVNKIVPNIVGSFHNNQPPKIFNINGNIEAEKLDISYTHVVGDINAENIIIGPEVTVGGKVFYKDTIELPEDSGLKVFKIE